MKYCTMCGKSYSDDTRFCPRDGYRLRDQLVFFAPQAEGVSPEVSTPRPQVRASPPVTFVSRRDSGRAPFYANLSSHRTHSGNGNAGFALGIAVIVIGLLILSAIVFVGFTVHDGFDGFGSSFGSSFGELGSRFGELGSRFGDMGSELGSRFGDLGSRLGDMGSELGTRCSNVGMSVGSNIRPLHVGALIGVLLFTSFLAVGVVLLVSSHRRRSCC